jgi:hypothetical protein
MLNDGSGLGLTYTLTIAGERCRVCGIEVAESLRNAGERQQCEQ